MSDNESGEEIDKTVAEFDFALPVNRITKDLTKRHDVLAILLDVEEDPELDFIFKTIASLCDPFTQPQESEDTILSVDFISDLVISIVYSHYIEEHDQDIKENNLDIQTIKFDISTQLFSIVRRIHKYLNAEDELELRFVNNDEEHYKENLSNWTPNISISNDEAKAKLVYSITCVLLLSIYKLFVPKSGEYNVTLNPYLHYFLKLWKCHTNIILLGLEIDRRIEFQNHEKGTEEETPEIVKLTLKGSSSIRYVLAWIINQNPSSSFEVEDSISPYDKEDLQNVSVFNFIEPLAKKKSNGGSLSIDMRLVIIALLIIYSGTSFTAAQHQLSEQPSRNEEEASRRLNQSRKITELGDILIDLEYDDLFDEDIKYIFDYEYDGSDREFSDNEEEEDKPHEDNLSEDDDIMGKIGEYGIEFDEFGRDWRDMARGGNENYQDSFVKKFDEFDKLQDKQQSDDIFASWEELYSTFEFLNTNSIDGNIEAEKRVGQVVINTIAKAVRDKISKKEDPTITPEMIYSYWSSSATEQEFEITQDNNKVIVPIFNITKFEIFLHNNTKLARCAMDEMLMYNGSRRIFIWFITHNLNISNLSIDYVFQLLAGLRGNNEKQTPYLFSRKGDKVILSEVEQSMLLHEFLTNANTYFSAAEGIEISDGYKVVLAESIAKKQIQVICLMIQQLINIGVIDLSLNHDTDDEKDDIHDYRNEIQILLIGWIGKVPEARQLFFKIKNSDHETKPKNGPKVKTTLEEERKLFERYSTMSINEISNSIEKKNLEILDNFTVRIASSIALLLVRESDVVPTDFKQFNEDLRFFLTNFNTLCKIEYVAETLFDKFEPIISTGLSVRTNQAPPPAASYSQAIKVNGFVYVSGQIPYTPDNKPLPAGATLAEQAEQVIQNVANILEASNSSLNHIVKANIFLTDMEAQFGEFNKVYAKYFSEHKPARSCVAVKELPLGVPLEMEVVAVERDDNKL
ncbi:Protein MMF1 mitochondrial [Spathaspora sp. JA1]|nr:Protein MMF1 mitochondrial [Spathaspora sp. JA1]